LLPERRSFALSVSGRVLLFTVAVWLVLLAGLQVVLDKVFLPSFLRMERELMVQDLSRIEAAVERETRLLEVTARNYAGGQEVRAEVERPGGALLPSEDAGSLRTLDLDAILVFDPFGRARSWSHAHTPADLAAARELEPQAFAAAFPVMASARAGTASGGASRRGLLRLGGGRLVFAAAAPVPPAPGGSTAAGTVVLLRSLDARGVERLAEQVRLPVRIEAARPSGAVVTAENARPQLEGETIHAEAWLVDPFGQPIARYSVHRPTMLLTQGADTVRLAGLGSLFMLSVVLAMLLLVLRWAVVSPLARLTASIEHIRATADLSQRLGINRNDEIGLLAYNFDRLLELLAERTRVLEELATTDGLTKLLNRRTIMERLEALLQRATGKGGLPAPPLSVLLLDVDHFKRINDTCGHPVGDRVLRQVARCLESHLRPGELAGRFGGEEFLVVLPDKGREDAVGTAELLRESIASTAIQGVDWPVTVSIGVATFADHTVHGLLATSDLNLYRAKERGRNRVVADDVPLSLLPSASIPPPPPLPR
jgi:diguanylate cyclase (GGDEF)-like protein